MNESHITTGIISFGLTIYLSIYTFGLFRSGIYLSEFVFFLVILAVIYLFLFYPIDFVCESIGHIENDDFAFGIKKYTTNKGFNEKLEHNGIFLWLYFIIILSIVNVIIVLPIKGIVYLIRKNKN